MSLKSGTCARRRRVRARASVVASRRAVAVVPVRIDDAYLRDIDQIYDGKVFNLIRHSG
jgi:hypothetical protein